MSEPRREVGLDIGATLAKIALREAGDSAAPRFELLPASDLESIAARVERIGPARVGVTGGGAARLAPILSSEPARVSEFDAWGHGATELLRGVADPEIRPAAGEGFLLVSLGTGTSVLHVANGASIRVGGTALGGGTVVGLGAKLTGASFDELCELAAKGTQAGVDLRVSDIYGPDEIPLAGDLTASNFGKLSRTDVPEERADLAAGVMGLVGENVALICAGLAAATNTTKIVYGGSTVRTNPKLIEILTEVTTLCGRQPCFLPNGEFAGALGALELASEGARG